MQQVLQSTVIGFSNRQIGKFITDIFSIIYLHLHYILLEYRSLVKNLILLNSASGNARPSTRPVLTGNGNRSPVNSGR